VSTDALTKAAQLLQSLSHPERSVELVALVAQMGGWPAVLAKWRVIDQEHALLADVWEIKDVLSNDAELVADRLGIDVSEVAKLVWKIESNVTTGRLTDAATVAASVAAVFAAHWTRLAAASDDVGAAQVAAWWQGHWERTISADSGHQAR
jgi:hypothetical protein